VLGVANKFFEIIDFNGIILFREIRRNFLRRADISGFIFSDWKFKNSSLIFQKKTDGSQAVGIFGSLAFYFGRIVTGIFSRCDRTRVPVNPKFYGKSGKSRCGVAKP
jgi:hypothetical protein